MEEAVDSDLHWNGGEERHGQIQTEYVLDWALQDAGG